MVLRNKRLFIVVSLLLVVVIVVVALLSHSLSSGNDDVAPALIRTIESKETAISNNRQKSVSYTSNIKIPEMESVLENDYLRFFMNKTNAEIAVVNKRSGQIWLSNPADIEGDTLASPYIKGKLSSQLTLQYLTKNGQTLDYDSFNDSVNYNQFEIQSSDQGITVQYYFGSPEKGIGSIPEKISKERFEKKLLANLADQSDRDQLLTRFKLKEEQFVYERREIPVSALKRLVSIFEKAGYTDEDLAVDNKENGVEESVEGNNPKFTVALQYQLDGENLIASVDTTAIIEGSTTNKIHQIGILENFGAASKEDEGYIFLPDGSGTLIRLNNGKNLAQSYKVLIYGEDEALSKEEKIGSFESSRMPVFGLQKNNSALFSIIEEGDALAKLSVDISGKLHNYNLVSSQFTVLPRDNVKLSNNETMIKTPRNSYKGKLQIRYAFLSGEAANYSGMANYYREYLKEKYNLKKIADNQDTPFYMEMVGSIPKKKYFLGIPYETLVPLTDYGHIQTILDQLNDGGVNHINLIYKGWFSGGLYHDFPAKASINAAFGSRREWQDLSQRLQESGGGLYPDVALLKVYNSGNGFKLSRDAVQSISRKYSKIFHYSLPTFQKDFSRFSHYLLSPNKVESVINKFLTQYDQVNTGAISLRDLGSELYSDFRLNGEVTRESAKDIVIEQAKHVHEVVPNVMANGGNVYLLPFVQHILNAPQRSSEYQLSDESVPFYQMVLHGYVDIAGQAFNIADNQDSSQNVLKALETGSNVYYSWIGIKPSILKDTEYEDLYANYYENWLNEAVQVYREVNESLKQVRGEVIVSHEKITENVYKTVYGNGKSVTVNYGRDAVDMNGHIIAAGHYIWEGR